MLLCALTLSFSMAAVMHQDPANAAALTKAMQDAMEVGDMDGVVKALRKYKEDAIPLFNSKAAARATSDDPALNDWCDTFIAGWQKAFRNDYARNYDRYLQRLSAEARSMRQQLIQRDYPRLNDLHIKAVIKKDPDVLLDDLRNSADALATAFRDLGDGYYLALVENIVGNLNNPIFIEKGADGEKAVKAYEACIEARDRLGLTNDKFYANTYRVLRDLRGRLGIPEPEDPNAPPIEAPEVNPEEMQATPDMPPVTAELVAEPAPKLDRLVHSADFETEQFVSWIRVGLSEPGGQITLPDILPAIRVLRDSANSYRLEAGAEPTEPFRLSTKPTAITVMRHFTDGSDRPYTLEVCTGSTTEVFQGVSLNLEPTDAGGPMFFRPLGTVHAETPYGDITLVDFSGDGRFGFKELKPNPNWAEGLLPETWFFRPDAIVLGKAKHSWPWSRFVPDEAGQWYELTIDEPAAPSAITLTPVTPTLGELQLDLDGPKKLKLASLMLVSDSSATKGLIVDLAAMKASKGRYQLPIGRYKLLQGRFHDPKKGGSVLMLPHASLPLFLDVTADTPVSLSLGAPFQFAAEIHVDGKSVTVNGRSLHLVGRSGERYLRVIGEPLFGVDVSAKGAKSVTLKAPEPEDTNKDWERLYYPMDAVLELKKAEANPAITLSLKKHPWFGKISTTLGGE